MAARKARSKSDYTLESLKSKGNTAKWIRTNYLSPRVTFSRERNNALKRHNNAMINQCLSKQGMDPNEYTLRQMGSEIVAWKLNGKGEPDGTLRR